MDIAALSLNNPARINPSVGGVGAAVPGAAGDQKSFGNLLGDLVDKVDGLQKDANTAIQDVVTGKVTDVHQVAVKVQEAGVAFDLMVGVRNRLMEAYQELIKMQP